MTPPSHRYLIGIDENGLGPRLGPMVVTAVMAQVTAQGQALVQRKAKGALARRLGDSKALVRHGKMALAEAWARALVGAGCGAHEDAQTPQALLEAISLDSSPMLQANCPPRAQEQCWGTSGDAYSEKSEGDSAQGEVKRALGHLRQRGVQIVAVRSVIICTGALNEAALAGKSRFVVDLHAMERLVIALQEIAGTEINAACGKVGGIGSYGRFFGPLAGRCHTVLEEGRARSAYAFPGLGELAFLRDGDDHNLLIGMASLVGKYLRELTMGRIVHHYQRADANVKRASGYHDPVTARFVAATSLLRSRSQIPSTCFERLKALPKKRG